jgi:hypothetical protein
MDTSRHFYIESSCLPDGLKTLRPSNMAPVDIYAMYTHVVDNQGTDSPRSFKFTINSVVMKTLVPALNDAGEPGDIEEDFDVLHASLAVTLRPRVPEKGEERKGDGGSDSVAGAVPSAAPSAATGESAETIAPLLEDDARAPGHSPAPLPTPSTSTEEAPPGNKNQATGGCILSPTLTKVADP